MRESVPAHAPILFCTESIPYGTAYNGIGNSDRRKNGFREMSDFGGGIFRMLCMKAALAGNTFSAERRTVGERQIYCFGIAIKNQECEFPCRSDAVIFIMPI